jgi:hypothetical protein
MVIHELCRPPRSVKLPEAQARRILLHLRKRFKHPLLLALMPVIESHIQGKNLPVSRAAYFMRQVARYPGQYNALSICYFSADDKGGVLEPVYENVIRAWATA